METAADRSHTIGSMKLTVVGCSPAWPNPGGAQSGYLVEAPGTGRLLLDCGPGVLARMREDAYWPQVDAIAITHFHLDHWGDVVPWVWGGLFGPGAGTEPPELLIPPGGTARLAELSHSLDGLPDMFEKAFRVREYAEDTPLEVVGFDLHPLRMPHYGLAAYSFRVAAGGRTLAYSGDSGPDERLGAHAAGADVFLCEATLLDPEPDPRGHLTVEEAEEAFVASGAARLIVTHRPEDRPVDARFELAYDGLETTV
jgi:ribonuclease BN (tRNA processing enzyme)